LEAGFIRRNKSNARMKNIIGYLQLMWLMKSPPALFSRLFGLPWYRNMLEQWIAPILTPDAKVLEVGCAGGDFSRSLAERNMKVWAADRSSRMLEKAQQIPSPVQFKQADATRLPFPDQYFDVVLAASLINVVDSPRDVLAEMRCVCRAGGMVSVLVPNRLFSDADAKHYLEAEQLSGFSGTAFATWHRLGRKMDVDVLHGYFNDCGMTNITTKNLLGGMVVAMSGQPSKLGEFIPKPGQ
jgi:ubiquinone/menaquinone biosynthesis C-methylase UbiE